MKKILSMLLAVTFMVSLFGTALAGVMGATCSEGDGGEMVKSSITYGEWYYARSYPKYENGAYYRHHVYARDVTEKWVCTVNSSHTETVRYVQTKEEVELQAYPD